MKHRTLFPLDIIPRAAPRKLMHMTDAGPGFNGCDTMACFECKRCGHKLDWVGATFTECRRGVPCEKCNVQK